MLIADTSEILGKSITRQLKDTYRITQCDNGRTALELLETFAPDILVLDTLLPEVDGLTVLRNLRLSGRETKVIVVSPITQGYVLDQLESYGVSCILTNPCRPEFVISHICNIGFSLRYPNVEEGCVENQLDEILLSLGFRHGRNSYERVRAGVLVKYAHPEYTITKEVYPAIVAACGGNERQTEKSVRDAIAYAFTQGEPCLWKLYFPDRGLEPYKHPSNDRFLSTIARRLFQWKQRQKGGCMLLKAE